MGTLGNTSGKEAITAFTRKGWQVDRQKGSHIILKHAEFRLRLSVPNHKEWIVDCFER